MEAPSIAILNIRIKDTSTSYFGSTAIISYHTLHPYYRGSQAEERLGLRDLPFSFTTAAQTAEYHAKVSKVLGEIDQYVSRLSCVYCI
jgi:hypothetical protein